MRRPDFQPPEADVEFSDAQLALIEIGRRQSVLSDPVDALHFALAQREIAERGQRQVIDEITAQVGREKRDAIFMAEAAELGVSSGKLKELLADPEEYRALMRMRAQADLVGIPMAQKLLVGHRRRTAELDEAALDRLHKFFDFSKPGRGASHYGMNRLGEMVAAEMTAEKKAKAALKPKPKKTPNKTSWRQNPGFRKAARHFAETGRGIVPDKFEELNCATGREADILEAAAALDEWDARREREGLDYVGFHWPDGET